MTIQANNPESIALVSSESVLPVAADDSKKHRYFTWRLLGFTKQEARELTPIGERQVANWYSADTDFKAHDNEGIRGARDKFAAEAVGVEFTRNLGMYMMLDRKHLEKAIASMEEKTKVILTVHEHAYIRTARSNYTPEKLIAMMKAIAGDTRSGETNIANFNTLVFQVAGEANVDAQEILQYGGLESGEAEELPQSTRIQQGSEAAS